MATVHASVSEKQEALEAEPGNLQRISDEINREIVYLHGLRGPQAKDLREGLSKAWCALFDARQMAGLA